MSHYLKTLFPPKSTGRDMRLNPFSLSFSKDQADLEKIFRTNYFHSSLAIFRLCHLISIFSYGLISIIDYLLFPDQFEILIFIKFAIVIPIFIIGFFITFHKRYLKIWPWLNNFYVVLTGSGFIAMIIVTPPSLSYSYYAGIIICLIFGYALIRSRFLMASAAGLTLSVLFLFVSIAIKTPANILIMHFFFLLTVNTVGMVICYSAEIYARRNFYLRHLLEKERKRVESINVELEQLVFKRTRKLSESNKQLRDEIKERKELETRLVQAQKMEAIGKLAGGIAHDFNNILCPVIGYTELLLARVTRADDKKYLEKIYSGSMRAGNLVKQIITFSRQHVSGVQILEVKTVVKEAMNLIKASIPASVEIILDIENDCGVVNADPIQIHQIVMNITTNAYQAMEKNGGQLIVKLYKKEIKETGSKTPPVGHYVCLVVTDSGNGTGMGLSVVHGIVQKCAGFIQINSELNHGTSVKVYLPLIDKTIETKDAETEPYPTGNGKILLVDDEPLIVEMVEIWLKEWGYQVVAHTESHEALEVFRLAPDSFDLVITDLNMPEMTGKKLSSEMLKIHAGIKILLCTGFNELLSKEESQSIGIKDYLLKPIKMRQLAEKLKSLLNP